jgi:hypothetical protein
VTDRIAHLDLIEQSMRVIGVLSGSIEIEVYLLEKWNRYCHVDSPVHLWLRVGDACRGWTTEKAQSPSNLYLSKEKILTAMKTLHAAQSIDSTE